MSWIKRLFKKEDDNYTQSDISTGIGLLKSDEYKVIRVDNVVVAQGYKCSKCKMIRGYEQTTCNCK